MYIIQVHLDHFKVQIVKFIQIFFPNRSDPVWGPLQYTVHQASFTEIQKDIPRPRFYQCQVCISCVCKAFAERVDIGQCIFSSGREREPRSVGLTYTVKKIVGNFSSMEFLKGMGWKVRSYTLSHL
jgi:hypothetical protein